MGRVGGLPWKLKGAAALGKKIIILQPSMEEDFNNIPYEDRFGITPIYADNFREVFDFIFYDKKK